jgi:outer membrane receptor protein involved in Fe transport
MKYFLLVLFRVIICIVVISSVLFAGTGKIHGKVTDATTGEPIVGANVLVVGTTLGAACDIEGAYTIIGVPVGSVSIKFSLVGYQEVRVNEVKVNADQTTPLNMKMTSSAVEMQGVEVTAEQLVNPLTTSSIHTESQKSIEQIPNVKNVQDVIALQAGVVKMGGNTFLRGGRANEVQYIVDGVPVNSIVSNAGDLTPTSDVNATIAELYAGNQSGAIGGGSSGLAVSANAIQSISVQTSGFDADLGNSQSGIVSITTRSGGEKFSGSLSYRTDKLAKPNFAETYGSFNFGGPEPISRYLLPQLGVSLPGSLTFFISGDANRYNGAYQYNHNRFYNPLKRRIEFRGLLGGILNGLGFNYQDDQLNTFTVNSKIRWSISNGDEVSYSYRASLGSNHDYNRGFRFLADSSTLGSNLSIQHVITWKHFFDQKTFAQLSLGSVQQNDQNDISGLPPYLYSTARSNTDINFDLFNEIGTGQRWYHSRTSQYSIRFDLNSQVHSLHFLKTGFEFFYETINSTEIKYPTIPTYDANGTANPIPDPVRVSTDRGEYPGYGVYRWALNNYPNHGSLWLQDNIEFEGLTFHVGLRYDYFDLGKQILDSNYILAWKFAANPSASVAGGASPYEPKWPGKVTNGSTFLYYLLHGYFSPRLAIGYPVTNRIVFYFNYGHFLQFPDRDNYFRDPFVLGDKDNWIGNPDLKPQRTVQYEAAFEDQVADDAKFAVRAFYKDIFDYATLVTLPRRENWGFVNLDFASARGFEIELQKSFAGGISATANYTYQIAKGRSSNSLAAAFTPDLQLPRETRLDWDQQHTANMFVSYRSGPRDPGLFGLTWANNFGISVTWSFGSGFPYTEYRARVNERNVQLVNNKNKPYTTTVNLSLNKGFSMFGRINLVATLDVENLLNRQNVRSVNTLTGQPSTFGDYDPDARTVWPWYVNAYRIDPTRFNYGRQILFGVRMNLD